MDMITQIFTTGQNIIADNVFQYFNGRGTIHILRKYIFRIFVSPFLRWRYVFSTENKQKLAFSDPPPPNPLKVLT